MTAPRLEVRLDRIGDNARVLVERLAERSVAVTGVTKVTLGSPELARVLLTAGVARIGESRIENIETLRRAGITAPIVLIRAPMLSQVDRVVEHADVSLNTELAVLEALSTSARAQHTTHGVVLMVELGDLREGILPADLEGVAREVLRLPRLDLIGIGTNLACHSGVAPDVRNMAELSTLADKLEAELGQPLGIVSGGNSANLDWALGGRGPGILGRVNDLRLGEAILLGCETLRRRPIDGLHLDACTLVAEVIEAKIKPMEPWGDIQQTAFGAAPEASVTPSGPARALLALGRQDTDPAGLEPPTGIEVLGASSDHLVVGSGDGLLAIGSELSFRPNYSALLAAMTSPFVTKVWLTGPDS